MVRLLCDADGNRDVYSLCCLCKNLIAIRLLNGDLKKRVYTIPVSNISDSNGNATLGVSTKDGILIALDITSPDYVSYQPTVVQQEWYIRCYKNTDVYSAYVGLISGKAYFMKLS